MVFQDWTRLVTPTCKTAIISLESMLMWCASGAKRTVQAGRAACRHRILGVEASGRLADMRTEILQQCVANGRFRRKVLSVISF
jgi:hypothetical protein